MQRKLHIVVLQAQVLEHQNHSRKKRSQLRRPDNFVTKCRVALFMQGKINGVASSHRILLIDEIRGAAIFGVVLFHIVWDLEFSGLLQGVAFHPIWLGFGKVLAGTFMFLVGVSLILAHGERLKSEKFFKRLAVVGAAAFLISVTTWFVFPDSFIFFGILHAISVSSLLGVLFLKLPALAVLLIALIFLILPHFASLDYFNTRWLAWTGLSALPPPSNDFVPVLPWAGITLLGMFAARVLVSKPHITGPLPGPRKNQITMALSWMGRNSLLIYLVHQPLLLAIILPIGVVFQS